MALKVAVITVSDRAAAGIYTDRSGPLAQQLLEEAGFTCAPPAVVPDAEEELRTAILQAQQSGARVILTTGGTGVGPRDNTPEVSAALAPLEVPGITEEIRRIGTQNSPYSLLSRARAGILSASQSVPPTAATAPAGRALLVNAPGSPGGVRDTVAVLAPLLEHLVDQLDGQDHS